MKRLGLDLHCSSHCGSHWGAFALFAVACGSTPAQGPSAATPAPRSSATPSPAKSVPPTAVAPNDEVPAPSPPTVTPVATRASETPVPAAPACPRIVASTAFEKTDWLGVYAKIVGKEGSTWGVENEPTTAKEARRASCWESSGRSQEPPQRSTACEGTTPWRVTTLHGFYTDVTFFVWPLPRERAVVYWTILGGSACSMEQPTSLTSAETRREGDLLVVEEQMTGFEWIAERSECVEASVERTIELYDLTLERGFRIEGLSADVSAKLVPSEHAVIISGAGCEKTIELSTVAR